jgi:hypothetical protein
MIMDALFWLLIGAFVGWNLPQPFWAKMLQTKLVDLISKKS